MRHSTTCWNRLTSWYELTFTPTMAQVGEAAKPVRSVTAAYVLTQGMLALAFRGTPASTQPLLVSAATFFSVWIVCSAILCRWQGATLSPGALYIHSVGPRAIPWPDIASLSTDRLLGITPRGTLGATHLVMVGQDANTGIDPLGAQDALRYITYLTIGYMVARGLAKSASRYNGSH